MNAAGFTSITTEFLDMWEMFLLCFVKRELFEQVANISAMKLAKGAMKGMIGNKGCIAYNLTLMNRHFNVIATHLRHGQNAVAERNQMASDLIQELKLQHLQASIPGLESDQSSDICIFMGDMNYRMNTRFSSFNNSNVRDSAVSLVPTLDQLTLAL